VRTENVFTASSAAAFYENGIKTSVKNVSIK
jgi:hypothetical protein